MPFLCLLIVHSSVIPLALVSFMESYSVAHRISTQRNELHFLHASQEMWANGVEYYLKIYYSTNNPFNLQEWLVLCLR